MEGKNESKHTPEESIQKIAVEFNEKKGRAMMFDEAYGIIETSYNLRSGLYNHEWSVKRNQAELYTESVRQFALTELRAEVDRLTKENHDYLVAQKGNLARLDELNAESKELVRLIKSRTEDPSCHDECAFLNLLLSRIRIK